MFAILLLLSIAPGKNDLLIDVENRESTFSSTNTKKIEINYFSTTPKYVQKCRANKTRLIRLLYFLQLFSGLLNIFHCLLFLCFSFYRLVHHLGHCLVHCRRIFEAVVELKKINAKLNNVSPWLYIYVPC